jgi:hypothetical protein
MVERALRKLKGIFSPVPNRGDAVMYRTMATCLILGVLGFACCYARTQEDTASLADNKIASLQQQRIELLQQRVAKIESLAKAGIADRAELIRPRMDVLNARLDYAETKAEKQDLLEALIAEYDQLIQISEAMTRAPVSPPKPGERTPKVNAQLAAMSDLLLLKSERVRIEIELELLK